MTPNGEHRKKPGPVRSMESRQNFDTARHLCENHLCCTRRRGSGEVTNEGPGSRGLNSFRTCKLAPPLLMADAGMIELFRSSLLATRFISKEGKDGGQIKSV